MEEVRSSMEAFGDVQEISEVKNYDESIAVAKKIGDATIDLRVEQLEENPSQDKIE